MSVTQCVLDNVEIRKLSIDDFPKVESLLLHVTTYWHNTPVDSNLKTIILDNYYRKISSPYCLCLGVFYNNEIVLEASGLFPERFPFWYNMSLHSSLKETFPAILVGRLQRILAGKLYAILMKYAEGQGYYNYYTIRPINHQRVSNKIFDAATPSSPMYRYEYYFEHFYPAGTGSAYKHHDVLFTTQTTYLEDSVVYLYCLAQEYRNKISGT